MSFSYQFPQHPKYRGSLAKDYRHRFVFDKLARLGLLVAILGACLVIVLNSRGYRIYKKAKSTNAHIVAPLKL